MTSLYDLYVSSEAPLAPTNLCWNMYAAGLEHIGKAGRAEACQIPQPGDDELLVRVDAVSLCLSDVKLINQGSKHPKLYNRDLASQPTRLGHEVSLTVMQVSESLKANYFHGQRLALQPDIYQQGLSTAYGYTIPGGLTCFHLIGKEVMHGDAGSYLLPVDANLGYAEIALTEPWACVNAAYTQRRRLSPKPDGVMWIFGRRDDPVDYQFTCGLDTPATIVTSSIPQCLLKLISHTLSGTGGKMVARDDITPANCASLLELYPAGFDDIILLNPATAQDVTNASVLLARRGTFCLVGNKPLDRDPQVDLGRIHYDYTAYLGTTGPDIGSAYGEHRNRCELLEGGTALFVGAGGPMGQMHIQRAIEMPNGPAVLLATDINPARLEVLSGRFNRLARQHKKAFQVSNTLQETLSDFVNRVTDCHGVDDAVVCVPSAEVMAQAAQVLTQDGMLVLFAGVPIETFAPMNLTHTYLHNAQFTGTSGSTLSDQEAVINSTLSGQLSPARAVAAIGGMEAALEGLEALMSSKYPGKIIIFPQMTGLPLTGLSEFKLRLPELSACLAEDGSWTRRAEAKMIELFWKP